MKKNSIFIVLFFLCILAFCVCTYAAPIYTYKEDIPVSDSITLTKVEEFYSDRNLSYSYIKADLSNENTSLKLLTSDKGTDVIETIGNLAATDEDTVAVLNGDFYSVHSGNKGFSLGVEIVDGEIIQSPINPDTMATVSYADGEISMSYLDFRISVVASNGESSDVRHLNKHTSYFGDILMYTSGFNGGFSPAPGGDIVEVVVSEGKVTEKRYDLPPVEIPEDGCVLVVSDSANPFFLNNVNVGDEIAFEYYVVPEIIDGQNSFGGGAMLLKDGEIVTEYSHVVSGRHPRSAIGVDESGTFLYLVAVNGRQDGSRGLTMSELSELMLSLGCYNAVNLDGGGSTHMQASTVWNEKMHTVNTPTENRRIINAVGLVYKTAEEKAAEEAKEAKETESKSELDENTYVGDDNITNVTKTAEDEVTTDTSSELQTEEQIENQEPAETEQIVSKEPAGILIESEKNAVFIGHPVKITAAAFDENMRPLNTEIDMFSAFGSVEGDVFIPEVAGWTTVEAMCGGAYASTEIYVVDTVSGIDTVSHIRLKEGETTKLEINVFDSEGHYVEITDISHFEIYSSNPSVVSVTDRTLTALASGTAIVSIQNGGVISNISVAVGNQTKEYTDNFEVALGKYKSYPSYVTGAFEHSNEQAFSGISSGKLSWDFTSETETDEAMGVYLSFDEKMVVADSEDSVSVKLYTENEFAHELRAQFIDGTGKVFIVSFGDAYETGTWQTLTAIIPDTAVRPLKLDSVYVVYLPEDVKDTGSVYLDDLSFDISVPLKFEPAEANAYVINEPVGEIKGQLAIGVSFGNNNNTLYADYVNYKTTEWLSDYTNNILLGNNSKFAVKEDDNALVITLDTSKGGIRNTDASQWDKMTEAINLTEKNNVFIFADNSVFGNLEFENRVLKDYLASINKNVFVITKGERNTYKNINGVKYFTLGNYGDEAVTVTHLNNHNGLVFNFSSESITFEWKAIAERA